MPGEAASMLHVTTRTLQRMAIRGEVEAIKLPSGHRRYVLSEIRDLADASRSPQLSEAAAS